LKGDDCSIHEIKPMQCRTYPFWPENLQSEKTWLAEKSYCEGIGPEGDPYRAPDIVALLKEQRATNEN
jgi:Fe-S-cluster containining protein